MTWDTPQLEFLYVYVIKYSSSQEIWQAIPTHLLPPIPEITVYNHLVWL